MNEIILDCCKKAVSAIKSKTYQDIYHSHIEKKYKKYYLNYDVLKDKYKKIKETMAYNADNLHVINTMIDDLDECFNREISDIVIFLNKELLKLENIIQKICDSKEIMLGEMVALKAFIVEEYDNDDELDDENDFMENREDESSLSPLTTRSKSQQSPDILHLKLEQTLQILYNKIRSYENFYDLNHFLIYKIAKKMGKLLISGRPKSTSKLDEKNSSFESWKEYNSYYAFLNSFRPFKNRIKNIKDNCVETYSTTFETLAPLSYGELKFKKNRHKVYDNSENIVWLKCGLILSLVIWIICNFSVYGKNYNFWNDSSAYLFSSVGTWILLQLSWTITIYVWTKYDIDYLHILDLHSFHPNFLKESSRSTDLILIYLLSILTYSFIGSSYYSISALTLVALLLIYQISDKLFIWFQPLSKKGYHRQFYRGISYTIFSNEVLKKIFFQPCSKVTSFKETYVADIFTSLTSCISNTVYASCWLVSGAFLTPYSNSDGVMLSSINDYGSSYLQCKSSYIPLVACILSSIPLIFRVRQCLMCYYYAPEGKRNDLYNSIKYILAIIVNYYGFFYRDGYGLTIIMIITALYRWCWDVIMDWGLFTIWPNCRNRIADKDGDDSRDENSNKKLFLRETLMYEYTAFYYLAIVIDLILRYIYIISLVPSYYMGNFYGVQLNFFLADLEVLRRCMWSLFRLEVEHLKVSKANTPAPGFFDLSSQSS